MKSIFGVAIMVMMLMFAVAASAQDTAETATSAVTQAATEAAPAVTQAATEVAAAVSGDISIYGEVQAVNAETGAVTVQYYDYDSDQEKTQDILVDSATKLENAKSVDEVKKGDWVDVTAVMKDGKCIAKIAMVEKEEAFTEEDDSSPASGAGVPVEPESIEPVQAQ